VLQMRHTCAPNVWQQQQQQGILSVLHWAHIRRQQLHSKHQIPMTCTWPFNHLITHKRALILYA
jgi:hypothetical protein